MVLGFSSFFPYKGFIRVQAVPLFRPPSVGLHDASTPREALSIDSGVESESMARLGLSVNYITFKYVGWSLIFPFYFSRSRQGALSKSPFSRLRSSHEPASKSVSLIENVKRHIKLIFKLENLVG